MMTLSRVFTNTLDAYKSGKYSIISNKGGTRSGKTYSVLQLLYLIAVGKQKNLIISVVSRTIPHLKKGAIRDFDNILASVNNAGLVSIQQTEKIYTFTNNNKVEFFSADDIGKLHGSARDILYINECNYIEQEKVRQLFVRTTGTKFLDYNPSAQFWIDDYREREDFIEFHSTYKDNDFLSDVQIAEIESMRKNERWWRVYGEGLDYVSEGLCYPNVIFDDPRVDYEWERPIYAMDFGFSDPTTLVKLEIKDDILYCRQILYQSNMDITQIKNFISKHCVKHRDIIICDSARPEIIRELHNDGFIAKPCKKGANSVFDGVQLVNQFEIHCNNNANSYMVKEFKSYSYEQDLDGNFTDTPEDKHNHALDALRYGVTYLRNRKSGVYTYSFLD